MSTYNEIIGWIFFLLSKKEKQNISRAGIESAICNVMCQCFYHLAPFDNCEWYYSLKRLYSLDSTNSSFIDESSKP